MATRIVPARQHGNLPHIDQFITKGNQSDVANRWLAEGRGFSTLTAARDYVIQSHHLKTQNPATAVDYEPGRGHRKHTGKKAKKVKLADVKVEPKTSNVRIRRVKKTYNAPTEEFSLTVRLGKNTAVISGSKEFIADVLNKL